MSKRLLLADDSITIQKVIGITFANEDFQLDVVDNGDAALQRAQSERPDLLLADVYMPGLNGYELCRAVKQDPQLQGVPVLLLTGTFEPFDEDKARQAGADGWISKPFESQTLIDKVDELLAAAAAAEVSAPATPVNDEIAPDPFAAPAVPEPAAFDAAELGESPVAELSDEAEPVMELAEDDLWLDEGSTGFEEQAFDLVEPEETSAAVETPVAVEPAVNPPVEDDDIWGAVSFDEDELLGAAVEESPAVADPETIFEPAATSTIAEDVWQDTEEEIFDLDDVDIIEEDDLLVDEAAVESVDEPVSGFDQAFEAPAYEPAAETADPFATTPEPVAEEPEPVAEAADPFADTPEPMAEVAEPVAEASDPFAATPEPVTEGFESVEDDVEEVFETGSFGGEEEVPNDAFADLEPLSVSDPEVLVPEQEPVAEPEAAFAGDEVAVSEVAEPVVESLSVAAPTEEEVAQQTAGLTETELAAIVERVAGEVIERLAGTILEKVAWEVVPDLAENLIKEEIRKIKTAV